MIHSRNEYKSHRPDHFQNVEFLGVQLLYNTECYLNQLVSEPVDIQDQDNAKIPLDFLFSSLQTYNHYIHRKERSCYHYSYTFFFKPYPYNVVYKPGNRKVLTAAATRLFLGLHGPMHLL